MHLLWYPFIFQAVPVRFVASPSNPASDPGSVLRVFERLTDDGGPTFDLLSLNRRDGNGTVVVDAFLALRENGVVLPREEAARRLRGRLSGVMGFEVRVGYSPCDDPQACGGRGECKAELELEEEGDEASVVE